MAVVQPAAYRAIASQRRAPKSRLASTCRSFSATGPGRSRCVDGPLRLAIGRPSGPARRLRRPAARFRPNSAEWNRLWPTACTPGWISRGSRRVCLFGTLGTTVWSETPEIGCGGPAPSQSYADNVRTIIRSASDSCGCRTARPSASSGREASHAVVEKVRWQSDKQFRSIPPTLRLVTPAECVTGSLSPAFLGHRPPLRRRSRIA